MFAHHSEVIAAIAIPAAAPNLIYTASLDCSVRCLDAAAGVSWEVVEEDEGKPAALCFDGGGAGGEGGGTSMWVGNRLGQVYHCDTRVKCGSGGGAGGVRSIRGSTGGLLQVHAEGKKITTVCLGPGGAGGAASPFTLLTAGGDGLVRLWDTRRLPKGGSSTSKVREGGTPIAELVHGSTVCSAYFSPLGTHIMSASANDYVRVWDTGRVTAGSLQPKHVLKHDMHTG